MAQKLGNDNIPNIVKASSTTITLASTNAGSGTLITIGGQQYPVAATLTLNAATIGVNGLDAGSLAANTVYYVYAILSANLPALIASTAAPSVGPSGHSNNRAIGVFKTLTNTATIDVATGIDPSKPGVDSDRINAFTNPNAFTGINNYVPPGVMFDFAGTTAPSADWLMCDGSAISRTTYANLFAVIGTAYGAGDGSTTFNLPDFRGRFARYNDNMGTGAAGRDTGRVHGSTQAQATAKNGLANSSSSVSTTSGTIYSNFTSNFTGSGAEWLGLTSAGNYSKTISSSGTAAAQSLTGDSETRPINLSCNKIIKV